MGNSLDQCIFINCSDHDSLDRESGEEIPETALDLNARPMHCARSEIRVQTLRQMYKGLSATSLTKYHHLACATPPFSPPAICRASPTHVLEAVDKYMLPYQQQRKLTDPVPRSWRVQPNNHIDMINVPKEHIHFFDGDSCEVYVAPDSTDKLKALRTHGDYIRVRLPFTDAPETMHSVRVYKAHDPTSTRKTQLLTRHIGIESLRATRSIIHKADQVFLGSTVDIHGNSTVPRGAYGRRIVHVFVETSGRIEVLAEILAELGFTMSFYTTGIQDVVDRCMRKAIANRAGIFSLPEEVFSHPFRPWELRKEWNPLAERYRDYIPISNPPECPELAWAQQSEESQPIVVDEEDAVGSSQENDTFFFRIVECKLTVETICYPAESTIPNAGYGLFLKSHHYDIKEDTHLCLYAEKPAPKDTSTITSGMYSLQVRHVLYDAEIANGNNLGRYANQPLVLDSLRKIKELSLNSKPKMDENDWRKVENEIDDACNARYKVVERQLVVVAKNSLPSSKVPQELFVNYGGLRSYWIPAELGKPGLFGGEISDIIQWLFNSSDCNWSVGSRKDWSFR